MLPKTRDSKSKLVWGGMSSDWYLQLYINNIQRYDQFFGTVAIEPIVTDFIHNWFCTMYSCPPPMLSLVDPGDCMNKWWSMKSVVCLVFLKFQDFKDTKVAWISLHSFKLWTRTLIAIVTIMHLVRFTQLLLLTFTIHNLCCHDHLHHYFGWAFKNMLLYCHNVFEVFIPAIIIIVLTNIYNNILLFWYSDEL